MSRQLRLFSALILALTAGGSAKAAVQDVVVAGSDYFLTEPGTFFNFGGSIGVVDFMGFPIGPGLTDTIVQRTQDVIINGASEPLQIKALSLESVAPVQGQSLFITLDPNNLANDTGMITINGSLSGGTFTSFFDVFFDVCAAPGVGGVGCAPGTAPILTDNLTLQNSGANWSPTPPAGAEIVTGPVGDLTANLHTGLAANEVDFFTGTVMETHPGGLGAHIVMPASIPEPSTWAMMLIGFAGLGFAAYRRARAAVSIV